MSTPLLNAAAQLRDTLLPLRFGPPVTHTYHPLDYAWDMHRAYLEKFASAPPPLPGALFLGMNPGPFGMAQTGVPFGEIPAVRDWMRLDAPVRRPEQEHPARPVTGLQCPRSEVSGRRLWSLFAARHPSPEDFFARHFVLNYCPLVFMESTGRNRTPDKLPPAEINPVNHACDHHLRAVVAHLRPAWLIGVGAYAEKQLRRNFPSHPPDRISSILHPSPASPAANRDWPGAVTARLRQLGLWE